MLFEFGFQRGGDVRGRAGALGFVAPAQVGDVVVTFDVTESLRLRVDAIGEASGEGEFDFLEVVPRFDFRGQVLPIENLKFRDWIRTALHGGDLTLRRAGAGLEGRRRRFAFADEVEK